ncbi:MAG: TetR/AcrR family transcriptional regulator [Candidatus Margulisiibacteriota bacterium]
MISPQDDSTKALLIKSAKKMFAKNGFDGTTVKDIADEAGVNIGAVSYHFNGKEGMYQSCIGQGAQQNLAMMQRILTPPQSVAEFKIRLQMFVEELVLFYAENPEVTKIVHREFEIQLPFMEDMFKNVFLKSFEVVCDFFNHAKEKGFLRADIEVPICVSLLIGALVDVGRMDDVRNRYFERTIQFADYRKKVVDHVVAIHVHGILSEKFSRKD